MMPQGLKLIEKKVIMGDVAFPIYGVILAGGWGTRFWPLSRSEYPGLYP